MNPLLLIGSAPRVWDDLRPYRDELPDTMAINEIGMALDFPLDHWFSNHPEFFNLWMGVRTYRFTPYWNFPAPKLHWQAKHKWVPDVVDGNQWALPWHPAGDSMLSAFYAMHQAGYRQFFIAGVSGVTAAGYYWNPELDRAKSGSGKKLYHREFIDAWAAAREALPGVEVIHDCDFLEDAGYAR